MKYVIKNFAPAWFASVMGTGILAINTFFYGQELIFLKSLATVLFILSVALFLLLIIPWTLRFVFFSESALSDLREPVTGQFYATMPIACLVLATDFLVVGVNCMNPSAAVRLAQWFWMAGAAIALIFSIAIPLQNFLNQGVCIENINPAWFMPPVSLIVIPVPGAKLIPYWPDSLQQTMLVFNYASWSSGFFLFLLLEAVCIYRFICHPPLPGRLVPTAWINLGPIGVGTIALLNLGSASTIFFGANVLPLFQLSSLLLWGFGFWWFICAVCLTIYYILKRNLPFTLSWWAFTFPLGAYAGATYLISSVLNSKAINTYGLLCYILLFALWFIVIVRTFVGIKKKELLFSNN